MSSRKSLGAYDAGAAYFGVQLRHIHEGTGFRAGEGGFDMKDIAMHAGVQASTVSRLINGVRINPYLDTILRVAIAFDIEPGALLPTLSDLKAMVAVRTPDPGLVKPKAQDRSRTDPHGSDS